MSARKLSHTIDLVIGDWSGDGHAKTTTVTILSTHSRSALDEAYKLGVKVTGVDLSAEVAHEYEDNVIATEILEKLEAHGLDKKKVLDDDGFGNDEIGYGLWPDSFADIWLFIAKVGDPDFRYKRTQKPAGIRIGGYGLYY